MRRGESEVPVKVDNHSEDLVVPRRHRRKKTTAASKWSWNLWRTILILCMGTSVALFVTWIRVQMVRMGYEISEATQARRELLQEHEWLKIKVTSLRSPERIEPLARSKLGLKPPERQQVRWLK